MIRLISAASVFGLVSALGVVALTLRWARRRQLLDHPNERSLHERPTPRGGGIGIVVPVAIAIFVTAVWHTDGRFPGAWLGALSLTLAAVGFLDDIRNLSAAIRLVIQTVAASLFVWAVGAWMVVSIPGVRSLELGPAAAVLTVVFLVWISNAYNFMDGIDGIAGVQGFIAGLGWVAVGALLNDPLLAVAGASVAFACLGFLRFNWSPASIFMGDVGTGFLGFLFGGLIVYASTQSPAAATAGVLFVWPFLADTLFTIMRRAVRGENLMRAHRSHVYQRLVLSGCSHRVVTLLYAGLAALGTAIGLGQLQESSWPPMVLSVIPALGVLTWAAVIRRERVAARS